MKKPDDYIFSDVPASGRRMRIDYDAKHDILTLIFGDIKNTYEDCENPKFGLIRNMDNDQLVGISCYGYKRFNLHDALPGTLLEKGVSIPSL